MNTILFNKEPHTEYAPLDVVHPEEIKIFAKFLKIEGVKSKENGKQLLKLEKKYPDFYGINLSWETREGIIKHTTDYDTPDYKDYEPSILATLEA